MAGTGINTRTRVQAGAASQVQIQRLIAATWVEMVIPSVAEFSQVRAFLTKWCRTNLEGAGPRIGRHEQA